MSVRDLNGAGVLESTWQRRGLPGRLPVWDMAELTRERRRVVVVAPHPDDEILGCGGTLLRLHDAGLAVLVVAVTDGEASHPGLAGWLRSTRAAERATALARLGLHADVCRLGLPDGQVQAQTVADLVAPLINADDLVLAPWRHDGHPDHDAVGAGTSGLAAVTWSYLVWAWHWATTADVPWDRAVRVGLGDGVVAAKRHAVAAFTSQLDGPAPILSRQALDRLLRTSEVLLRAPDTVPPLSTAPASPVHRALLVDLPDGPRP